MISKSKFLDWKSSEVTKKLIEVITDARNDAINALVQSENPEFRGAIKNFNELLTILQTGDVIIELEEEEDVN